MGKFQVGQEKPQGSGRKKGTQNKRTQNLALALDELKLDVPGRLAKLLPKLSEEKQVDLLMGLLPYLYPKLKTVEQIVADDKEAQPTPFIVQFVSAKNGRAVSYDELEKMPLDDF